MGGHALKNTETERKNKKEYDLIFDELSNQLFKYIDSEIWLTKPYYSKQTFGDMDILVKGGKNYIKCHIETLLNPNEIITNGNVISFDYKKLQIDLIFIKKENWETSKTWYSFDPLPNILGKLAHKFGVKYGHVGLTYPYRGNSGKIVKDIVISKDSRKIFEFLGMDYDVYLNGFDTKKEIFDYVIDSKFFNFDIFKFENLNHVDKKRNRKRPTYNEFLEYANGIVTGPIFDRRPSYNFNPDKDHYIDYIDLMFPECKFTEQLKELEKRSKILSIMHSKFNGKIIMEQISYLRGKMLGRKILEFKNLIGTNEEYEKYILSNTTDKIMSDFRSYHIDAITVKNNKV